jgi:hypothetical protein
MESRHCKLGPGKCRDCDREAQPFGEPISRSSVKDLMAVYREAAKLPRRTSHYDSVLQSVLALEKREIQRIYEYLHKIGHTIYRE